MKYRGKVWIITCAIASLICVVAVSIVVTNFNSVPVTPEQAQTVSEKISSETSDQQQDPRMNPETVSYTHLDVYKRQLKRVSAAVKNTSNGRKEFRI